MAVAPPLSTHVSRTLTSNLHLWPRTHGGVAHARTRALIPTPAAACAFRFSFRVRATASGSKLPPYPLPDVFPYITAEWEAVAKGWACAAVAVYCLSRAVPAAGRLPRALAGGGGGGGAAVVVAARGGVALAAFASARAAATYAQQAFLWEAALQAAGRLRERAFERLLERDLEFFEGRGGVAAGDIAHRITDEADDVADALFSVLNVIPCMCFAIVNLGKRLRQISKEAHLSLAMLASYLNDVLPSMLTVKANNGELKEIMRFQKLARADLKNNLSKKKMKALIPQAVRATYIGGLLVLCAGSIVVSGSSFDAEEFLSFLTALALVVEPIQDAGKAYNEYKQGQPALERIFDLMRFNPKVTDKPRAIHLQSINGDIKFHDVTFRYVDDMPPVADGVNLHIRPGEIIALVGPSGGGKTTLAKLLLRLYHPQKGYILLDNHDIQDIQSQCLRTHIAFVSQDTMLFSGTIAENIAYRDPVGDIDMNRVEYAAKIANAEEFIKMLPEGYNSNVGQRGSSLSGGQKQRLSIARAIYQNSSILIMDEATSALDIRSELLLKEALSNLIAKHSVTVIIIAHRQEMVLMADRIISLERGELREMSKQAFLSQDGHFSLPRIRSPN
ncbi:ABC transporter B family member 29, chloroplastic isoform X2 [Zea mays]|uniref:ABC transporter B family member 29 chloroplastic n=1 Tax=Zea mays TaxID=4577 RepID=A0A1D6EBI5_MAIZE|nr:ABC transporter B family member 29, chloroplastic isoform X2 [Zea mays]ONM17703.1 ABC transporter B family member 29 chloroplastic [Zea mays]|eukprot:XP_008669447.1 ABC transporter B family member 29, chloroplastic isoform X2 [Zea mays]